MKPICLARELFVMVGLGVCLMAGCTGGSAGGGGGNANDNANGNQNANDNTGGGDREWEPAGFGAAGNFTGVYYDPSQEGTVYACSDVSGVLRSEDGGRTWQIRSIGLGNYEITSFAIDPFDSDTLYAGAGAFAESNKAGIYVSHNAGLTWQHLPSTFQNRITFRRYRTSDAIAADPSEQGVLLGGSRDNGIWRSTDAGQSWTRVFLPEAVDVRLPSIEGGSVLDDDPPAPSVPAVSVVVFDPNDSDVVYAGLLGGGVVKSTDGGSSGSWQAADTGLPESAVVEGLAVGPNNVLYAAAAEDGVFKSTDGGDTWQAVNAGVPLVDEDGHGWRSWVAVRPDDPDIAYMARVSYYPFPVYRTTDGGASWDMVPDENLDYDVVHNPTRAWLPWPQLTWQVKVDPFDSDRLLAVNFWSIQRSDDGGETWADSIVGAQNTCITSVYVDTEHPAGEPDTLYGTHMDAGLLRSTDNGDTWTAVLPSVPEEQGPLSGHCWRFAAARGSGSRFFFMTANVGPDSAAQVLRSANSEDWTTVLEFPVSGDAVGLAVDPVDPATLYAAQDGGQIFKTLDSGDTWEPTAGQPGANTFTFALAVDDEGRVFAGTRSGGLWRSTDGGESWQPALTQQGTIWDCVVAGGAVYASAGDANLYRSTDGGDTWQALTAFESVDDGDEVGDQGAAIGVDPSDPDHILFSRRDPWHVVDDGPGVVESFDGGESWELRNEGLGMLNVSSFAFGSDGTVFAGTWCAGTWRLPAE